MHGTAGFRLSSKSFGYAIATAAACLSIAATSLPAAEQSAQASASTQSLNWRSGYLDHVRRMRRYLDHDRSSQEAPAAAANIEFDNNESGILGSYRPGGVVMTPDSAFLQPLGTNGRSCFTCHQPQDGWSVSAAGARARFAASGGADPLFRLVDGATCPTAPVETDEQRQQAFRLLTDKGLFRIGLPLPQPPALQFKIAALHDPYHCSSNPATGLTSQTSGILSVYRRPLAATNLGFLSTIMWDGREPDLTSQAVDATLGHAQANAAPTTVQQDQMVAFESGIFTAQAADRIAGDLGEDGAKGGPVPLSKQVKKFFIGVNDPTGQNPNGTPFDPKIFDLYKSWRQLPPTNEQDEKRRSIARGEKIFNSVPIRITDVGGINDPTTLPVLVGTCGSCHDTPNVGSHSVPDLLDIGISNGGASRSPGLNLLGLPTFMLECTSGPLAGQLFETTDPGRALITGQCADIGKFKIPSLRGLAARAPYFHNGAAATLSDVVTFYDRRFSIGLTKREKQDLVNFLSAL